MYSVKVRGVLEKHGRLAVPVDQLQGASDLYKAGLTSIATVSVMLALEEQFDVEFPDNMLNRRTFASIDALVEAVSKLSEARQGARSAE